MTKPPLYAAAQIAASVAALVTVLVAPARARSAWQPGACVTCLSIAVDAAVSLPGQLEGLEVFVRGNAGSEAAALAALTEIEQKGGRPALLVSGIPGPLTTDVRDHVGRIVIVLPPQPPDQS